MKHLKFMLPIPLMVLFLIVSACQKDNSIEPENQVDQTLHLRSSDSHEVPFKAKFFTRFVAENLNEVNCTNPDLPNSNYQAGNGTGTHLGAFNTVITFCGGENLVYGEATGYFEAANGDRLFVKINLGQVIPITEPHPIYEAYFQDPFEFCDGTGRFEGASGGGMTDSYVDLWNEEYPFPGPPIPDHKTDHVWRGTLILPN